MPGREGESKVVVRCLGPGRKGEEHTFRSPNPTYCRVCEACRLRIARMGKTRIDEPMRVNSDG